MYNVTKQEDSTMAFDGVLLNGLAYELKSVLLGGRIEKIQQPETDEIHVTIRNKGCNYKLLLSANANYSRVHLTNQNKANPINPPMFCMVLRKHISGSKVSFIRQHGMDRILEIGLSSINELGDIAEKSLIVEIMGKHSNIILIDSDNYIIDAVKHINENISRVREVLPGRKYIYPPSQGKTDPLTVDTEHVEQILRFYDAEYDPVDLLVKSYTGISKVTAKEICHRGNGEIQKIALEFHNFFQQVKDNIFQPTILLDEKGNPNDIFPMRYTLYSPSRLKTFYSFSDALDEFFLIRDRMERLKQRTSHLIRIIKNNLVRCNKKIEILTEQFEKAKDAEQYRLFGELITANIHQISAGVNQIEVINYYSPDNSIITIPLDPSKTPAQNAQHYFKNYNKLKRMKESQSRLIKDTKEELDYLESVYQHITSCTDESDILEIQEELIKEGYIKELSKKNEKKQKNITSKPLHFVSSDGMDIFVGKNNLQNDRLTLKLAHPKDLWLHTRGIHGSHVIVKTGGKPVPYSTLLEAANLAAYYSKGRYSTNVPVDYCIKKFVRKPSGAKPGMVVYENYKTIYITPSENTVLSLRQI